MSVPVRNLIQPTWDRLPRSEAKPQVQLNTGFRVPLNPQIPNDVVVDAGGDDLNYPDPKEDPPGSEALKHSKSR